MKIKAAALMLLLCAASAAACDMTYTDSPGGWDLAKYRSVINGSGTCGAIGTADGIKCCFTATASLIGNFSQYSGAPGITFAVPYFSVNMTFDAPALNAITTANLGLVNATGVNDVMGNTALGHYGIAWVSFTSVGGAQLHCHDGTDGSNKANSAKNTLNHTVEFIRGVGDTTITATLYNATGSRISMGTCPYTDNTRPLYPAISMSMINGGTPPAACVQLHTLNVKSQINISASVYINDSLGVPQEDCLVQSVPTLGEAYPAILNTSAFGLAGPFIMEPSCAQGVKWSGYFAAACPNGAVGYGAADVTLANTPQTVYLTIGGPNGSSTQTVNVALQSGAAVAGASVTLTDFLGNSVVAVTDASGNALFNVPAGANNIYISALSQGYAEHFCDQISIPTGSVKYCVFDPLSKSATVVINASDPTTDMPLAGIFADTYVCPTQADCLSNLPACTQLGISRSLDAGGDASYSISGDGAFVCVSLRNSGVPNQPQAFVDGATLTYAFDLGGGKLTQYCMTFTETFPPYAGIDAGAVNFFASGSSVPAASGSTDSAGAFCFNATSTDGMFEFDFLKTGYEYHTYVTVIRQPMDYISIMRSSSAVSNATVTAYVTLNGSAVASQTMNLICNSVQKSAQTNATGYAVWQNITLGSFCRIEAAGTRYNLVSGGYNFDVTGPAAITVILEEKSVPEQQRRSINVIATDIDDGFSVAGASFAAVSPNDATVHTCTTANSGICQISGLFNGISYSVTAQTPQYEDWSGTITGSQTTDLRAELTAKGYNAGKCQITILAVLSNGTAVKLPVSADMYLRDISGGITHAATAKKTETFTVGCGTIWTAEAQYAGTTKTEKVTAPPARGQSVSVTLMFGASAPDREADKAHFMDTVWGMLPIFELIFVLLIMSIVMMGLRSLGG